MSYVGLMQKDQLLTALFADYENLTNQYCALDCIRHKIKNKEYDADLHSFVNKHSQLSAMVGTNLPLPSMEHCNDSLFEYYTFKIEATMEGLISGIVSILKKLFRAFKEFMLDYIESNRRWRLKLQTHYARMRNDLNAYGNQPIFNAIELNTYTNVAWNNMADACKTINNTYIALQSIPEQYISKFKDRIKGALNEFGQDITAQNAIVLGTNKYERNLKTLGAARWQFIHLPNYTAIAIDLLTTDFAIKKIIKDVEINVDGITTKLETFKKDLPTGEQASEMKRNASLIMSIVRHNSNNSGIVARTILDIANTAQNKRL